MNFAFISEGEIDRDEEEVFEEELEFLPEDK
jgi:hypothetical protein